MSIQIASINSGSNGNCYYVGNETDAILVDAGIAARNIEKRLKNIGLNIKNVRAIFVSHEHSDHIKGLATLAHRHFLPIYISEKTAKEIHLIKHLSHFIEDEIDVQIGSLTITPFKKNHDGVDPYSFTIKSNETYVGVYTDMGIVCDKLQQHFSKCKAAFLESNYDEKMLVEGRYHWSLKNRIMGNDGHLSNEQAVELFKNYSNPKLELLILSHLSKENNSPELVKELFEKHNHNKVNIFVAERYNASAVYTLGTNHYSNKKNNEQLQLF